MNTSRCASFTLALPDWPLLNRLTVRQALLAICVLPAVLLAPLGEARAADQLRVGIGNFDMRAPGFDSGKQYRETYAFSDQLTTHLVQANKFDVIERSRLAEILREQGLSRNGIVDAASAASAGKVAGLNYLVVGSFTEFQVESKPKTILGITTYRYKIRATIDVRVVNTTTGSIEFADNIRIREDMDRKIGGKNSKHTQEQKIEQMLIDLLRNAAATTALKITAHLFPIKIVTVQPNGEVVLNYGKGALNRGDVLVVYSQGETFTDPDTGEVLGSTEERVAELEVTDTQHAFSKARVRPGGGSVERGMIARRK